MSSMTHPPNIHDEYFSWLYDKVSGIPEYVNLSSYIHNRWEFYWSVPYDENRQADGYDQRESFLRGRSSAFSIKERRDLLNEPVSVFEVLVALCERMDFNLYDLIQDHLSGIWYRELLDNIGLSHLNDGSFHNVQIVEREVDDVMRILLDRTYDSDGTGSLFPLDNAEKDMRDIELWYQMMAYLNEKHPI